MSTPRLIELAKDGNPRAIARLINQQLEGRGMTAIASREGSCLRLLLEAPKSPKESVMVPYIQRALTKLSSSSFDQVEVYGRRKGSLESWQRQLVRDGKTFVVQPSFEKASPKKADLERAIPEKADPEEVNPDKAEQPEAQTLAAQKTADTAVNRARKRHRQQQTLNALDSLDAQLLAPIVPGASLTRHGQTAVKDQAPTKRRPSRRRRPLARLRRRSRRIRAQVPVLNRSVTRATSKSSRSISPERPSAVPFTRLLSIWFQWQGAAWLATFLTSLIAIVVFSLVFFGIFSLANRLTDTAMLILSIVSLGIMVPILGLLLGDAQTQVLHRRFRGAGGWRWLTMLGLILGVLTAWGAHQLLSNTLGPLMINPTEGFVVGQGFSFVASTVGVIFGLMSLSTVQWLVIRSSVPRAYEWVLVNVFGGLLSWIIGMTLSARWITPLMESNTSYDFWSQLAVIGVGGILSWLVFHAVSGLGMARLLQRLPLRNS